MNVNEQRIDAHLDDYAAWEAEYLEREAAREAVFCEWLKETVPLERRADMSDAYHGKPGVHLTPYEWHLLRRFQVGL